MKQAINKVKSVLKAIDKWCFEPVGFGYTVTTDTETNTKIYSEFKLRF